MTVLGLCHRVFEVSPKDFSRAESFKNCLANSKPTVRCLLLKVASVKKNKKNNKGLILEANQMFYRGVRIHTNPQHVIMFRLLFQGQNHYK